MDHTTGIAMGAVWVVNINKRFCNRIGNVRWCCGGRVCRHAWLEHGRSRVRARRAARLISQLSLLGKRLIPHSASVHSAVSVSYVKYFIPV